eukprot:TRINITY_DN12809_c0_g1_i1.p1 TRINITY_DN12809_c0_g1~~TRINITY_DN12809_c0_g1_i1.p1  ORF type:complete len:365 (+),score=93.87 TRINITY_DN12809_c0_g1_i1:74-1168(+)
MEQSPLLYRREMPGLIEIEERLKQMEATFDTPPSLILDNGTDSIKYGFSGQPLPKTIKLPENPCPIKRGVIENFEAVSTLWSSIIDRDFTEDLDIVLLDAPFPEKSQRKQLASIFFEQYAVRSLSFLNSAVASLFSTGKTKGLVLSIGEGITFVAPIFESCMLSRKLIMNVAGKDVTMAMGKELGVAESVAKVAKEKFGAVKVKGKEGDEQECGLILPDGRSVKISSKARHNASELLFKSTEDRKETVQSMVLESLKQCPSDIRPRSVVLAGGSTLLKGLRQRLAAEFAGANLEVLAETRRQHAAWIGASMLSSFSTFSEMRVTVCEYKENPELIFNRDIGLSLIHICRCRRYAVCRSRWSPYH